MQLPALSGFRLAGGTALALHRGHRESVDLDLFAERSFTVRSLVMAVTEAFPDFVIDQVQAHGVSAHWQTTKVDLYYMGDFLYPAPILAGVRLADVRDLAAMKLECVLSRKERKDYHDIAQLLQEAPLAVWLAEFQKKYPYYQTRAVIDHLLASSEADASLVPQILNSLTWKQAKEQVQAAVQKFLLTIKERETQAAREREEKQASLLKKRKKN
jgi:hypothetical protein